MAGCDLCFQECKELTHLSLYLNGSEGTMVCLNCRMALTEFARQLRLVASIARKQGFLMARRLEGNIEVAQSITY